MKTDPALSRPLLAMLAVSAVLAACGGSDDDNNAAPAPLPTIACSFDTTVALAFEEQRLTTPLPNTGANVVGTDTTPIADRIVKRHRLRHLHQRFRHVAVRATARRRSRSYDGAVDLVKAKGAALWRGAVDRVQGRRPSPATSKLPNSDDRMLYWTRVQMTKLLRQWKPAFAMTPAQLTDLQLQLERSSRGQYDINLPAGEASQGRKYRRMIISGFDTFTLGTPGTPNTGLRNGNPSGATALEMDGREFTLSDGTVLHVEAYILPVSYDPFNLGMQEDTLGRGSSRDPCGSTRRSRSARARPTSSTSSSSTAASTGPPRATTGSSTARRGRGCRRSSCRSGR
jgi:hypothetical protein